MNICCFFLPTIKFENEKNSKRLKKKGSNREVYVWLLVGCVCRFNLNVLHLMFVWWIISMLNIINTVCSWCMSIVFTVVFFISMWFTVMTITVVTTTVVTITVMTIISGWYMCLRVSVMIRPIFFFLKKNWWKKRLKSC